MGGVVLMLTRREHLSAVLPPGVLRGPACLATAQTSTNYLTAPAPPWLSIIITPTLAPPPPPPPSFSYKEFMDSVTPHDWFVDQEAAKQAAQQARCVGGGREDIVGGSTQDKVQGSGWR